MDTLEFSPTLAPDSIRDLSTATQGWVPLTLDGLPPGQVGTDAQDSRPCLMARTDGSVVALGRPTSEARAQGSRLSWSWYTERGVPNSSLNEKRGDDFGARVLVNFKFDESREGPLARMGRSLAGDRYGLEAPGSAISYVWSETHPEGSTAWSPYTDRVATVVIQSGPPQSAWRLHARDVGQDYETLFGHPAPPITSIVLFSDSDDTGGMTATCFGPVSLVVQPR